MPETLHSFRETDQQATEFIRDWTIGVYERIASGELEGHIFADPDGNVVHVVSRRPGEPVDAFDFLEVEQSAQKAGLALQHVSERSDLMTPNEAQLLIDGLRREQ